MLDKKLIKALIAISVISYPGWGYAFAEYVGYSYLSDLLMFTIVIVTLMINADYLLITFSKEEEIKKYRVRDLNKTFETKGFGEIISWSWVLLSVSIASVGGWSMILAFYVLFSGFLLKASVQEFNENNL